MVSISVITILGSLVSLATLIGRKFVILKKNGGVELFPEARFELPYLDEVKNGMKGGIKRFENLALVFILRLYIRSANFVRSKYKEIKKGIRRKLKKQEEDGKPQEVSKFLQMIENYKDKVDEMKEQIQKEEKNS